LFSVSYRISSPLHTYSMVQNPSWEANWFAASQEIPHISRNPKVHYRTHKRPPFFMLRDASPRIPPPGDPSWGVVYLRIVLSPEESSRMWVFLNINVLQGGVVSTSPKPQAGEPPLVGSPRLLIQFIRSYAPYRMPISSPFELLNSINRIYKSQETIHRLNDIIFASQIVMFLIWNFLNELHTAIPF